MNDRSLVKRVRSFVDGQPESYTDVENVIHQLQKQYPEYKRRKRQPLVAAITQILEADGVPLSGQKRKRSAKNTTVDSPIIVDSNDDIDDIIMDRIVEKSATNRLNNSLRQMYNRNSPSVQTPTGDQKRRKVEGSEKKTMKSSSSKINMSDLMTVDQSSVTFDAVGGCHQALLEMCKLCLHLVHPEIFTHLSQTPPTGFLLHGPPGCGKTLLAKALAGQLSVPLISVASPQLVAGVSGESESRIRDLFTQVKEHAPCILLLDEIDAISPKRDGAQREMERRIVAQLLNCLDEVICPTMGRTTSTEQPLNNTDNNADESIIPSIDTKQNVNKFVVVIGVTSRLDAIDPALRRAGRFDREIAVGIPTELDRIHILRLEVIDMESRIYFRVMTQNLRLSQGVSLNRIARLTPGYVGADLLALCREANMLCVNRVLDSLREDTKNVIESSNISATRTELNQLLQLLGNSEPISSDLLNDVMLTADDFEEAIQFVQPSAKREGFATVPDITWEQIGALASVRDQLNWSILFPIKYPEEFDSFGLSARPQGVMLCGPPGCGKTLLAKAVANETGMNFISVKGPELLSMYVGESERAVRQLFQRARDSAPCVVFFDEIDALCPRRIDGQGGGSVRVVNQLLTELDGMESRKQVYVIAATNRPDMIDPAVLRPGRLDKTVYVGLPSITDRRDIIRAITKNETRPKFAQDVDLEKLCSDEFTANLSGADLAALIREASVSALREKLEHRFRVGNEKKEIEEKNGTEHDSSVHWRHLQMALNVVKPSVNDQDRIKYALMDH